MKNRNFARRLALTFGLVAAMCAASIGQDQAITYQGKLNDAGTTANGPYDFIFRLFPVSSGGSQIGTDITVNDLQVTEGVFTVNLPFNESNWIIGSDRFLEILVRPGASSGSYTTLSPRNEIKSVPTAANAAYAANSGFANTAGGLDGTPANQFARVTDPRFTDAHNPLPNSTNYVQNGTGVQGSTDFNISGNGTVGGTLSGSNVNAGAEFRIAGNRVLSLGSSQSTYLGLGAGTAGTFNTFSGNQAGRVTTSGSNSFFGASVGFNNTSGADNSFFGVEAGRSNTTGNFNSFFGRSSGFQNVAGKGNSFFGHSSGFSSAGGNYNTMIGYLTDTFAPNASFATAIGAHARVTSSDTIVIGKESGTYDGIPRPADVVQVRGNLRVNGDFGLGLSNANFRLHVRADGQDGIKIQHTGTGEFPQLRWTDQNDIFKASIGVGPAGNEGMLFFLNGANRLALRPNGNVGIGTDTPAAKVDVSGGSVYIRQPNSLIITSGNGSCWFITVNDAGALATISVPCPL